MWPPLLFIAPPDFAEGYESRSNAEDRQPRSSLGRRDASASLEGPVSCPPFFGSLVRRTVFFSALIVRSVA